VESAKKKGFSTDAISAALLNSGWQPKDIQKALYPPTQTNTPKESLSPFAIIVSIALFILFGGSAAYTLYWYQSGQSPRSSIQTPDQSISPTASPTIQITPYPAQDQASTLSSLLSSDIPIAHNGFGFDVLKELTKKDMENNIVISPPGIALALSMTLNGASESTKIAMAKTLKTNAIDIKKLNEENALLIKLLSNPDPGVTLTLANSIWTKKGLLFLPEFLQTNKTYYNAEIQSLDFSMPSSVDTINTWVSKSTKGKIPTIVSSPLDSSIVMYLINAIYFYGTWTNEFDATLTEMKPFTLPTKTKIQHPYMVQTRKDFLYQNTDIFQAIQLPYGKNKSLSMTILLPKNSSTDLFKQLTHATWNSWMKSFSETEGTVFMPKFKIEYMTSLKNSLLALGMVPAFSSETANFSGMRQEKDLFISDVVHKTYIDVNEKGTQAAAVTSSGFTLPSNGSAKKTFTMDINKPFFFAITDSGSGEILFMGTVHNPVK